MRKRLLKNKLILIGLASILFVSCGGGSSNAPVNPGANVSPKPKKPDTGNIINPSNPSIPKKPSDSKIEDTTKPGEPENPSTPSISKRETLEELRTRINDETKVREFIFNELTKSTEAIPSDSRELNGSTQKVAILDGDFLEKKQRLENIYSNIEILDRVPVGSENNKKDHGEIVLKALRQGNKLSIIAGSIGSSGDVYSVAPKFAIYEETLKKFDPNQKVKVFNQSWGTEDTITKAAKAIEKHKTIGEDYIMLSLAPNSTPEEGRKIFAFYKDVVNNKGGLFVWANGNRMTENDTTENGISSSFSEAALQPGLPALYSSDDLEKGWITVIGVEKQRGDKYNIHFEGKNHLAYPGNKAKWWAISADAEIEKDGTRRGSSFAAPRVARTAALVAEKYDWMTADQVRQTLFTTTDAVESTEKGERSILTEPDDKYGWGMLNQERALKGPGAFINIRRQYEYSPSSNNIFSADIPQNKVSYFENDIYGDGGLIKLGKGTLHLTGNNSYQGSSVIKEGILEIHKIHSSDVKVEENGNLVLHSKAIIGYKKPSFSQLIDKNEISAGNIIAKDVDNKGTVKVIGTTAIIGGNYIAHTGSKTEMDISSKVRVLGDINIQGGAITLLSNNYVTTEGITNTVMEGRSVEGNIANVETNGMRNANIKVKAGKIVATLSRKNTVDYIGDEALESSKNVAENVEKVFQDLDQKVMSGTATKDEIIMGTIMQTMSTSGFVSATEMMSGEIYASSQALTFSQAQNVNRDLSNRLAGLDNFKNSNKDSEVWFSVLGSTGKLRRDGYASADTRVTGGQFGIDTKFEGSTTLGVAVNYSYAKADFNRYAGESKSDMVGVSFYGKQELPYGFYAVGRLGLSNISTKVERELLTSSGDTVTGKINHHDKMLSGYLELGKKFSWFTPYIGYSQDYLRRGSFNESEASWGIKADKKNYRATNFLVGMRAEYVGDKYKLQAYVSQSINTGKRDLTYEGSFTGSNVRQKFKGVKQAKNTTWIGVGAFREITPVFGVYGNVDFRIEDKKWADSVFSTGLQYRF